MTNFEAMAKHNLNHDTLHHNCLKDLIFLKPHEQVGQQQYMYHVFASVLRVTDKDSLSEKKRTKTGNREPQQNYPPLKRPVTNHRGPKHVLRRPALSF